MNCMGLIRIYMQSRVDRDSYQTYSTYQTSDLLCETYIILVNAALGRKII